MIYILSEIGKRIETERKRLNMNQSQLAKWITENCYTSCVRQTLAKWEDGISMPPLDIMLSLCQLFDCDIGYLLCEYDNRYRVGADVADATGLSPETVEKIMNTDNSYLISGLDKLFSANSFINLLISVGVYSAYILEYRERSQEPLDNRDDQGNDFALALKTQISMMEYNLDTDFRNVINEISPISRPHTNH